LRKTKFKKLMPVLALLFHLIEVIDGTASGPVTEIAAHRAAKWCDFLESHARRIYGLAIDIRFEAASKLAKKIKAEELPNPFTTRDVPEMLGDARRQEHRAGRV
jgi:Protein of unknown function (DUF3987)